MERKMIICILVLISGVALSVVSIWLLIDTPKFMGVATATTEAPKVGIAAGVIAVVAGIACFFLKELNKKNMMLGAIFVLLILAITTFSLALKELSDLKKLQDVLNVGTQIQKDYGGITNNRQGSNSDIFTPIINKLKPQLTVLIVAGAIAILLQIVALVLTFRMQPPQTSRNALPTEKPY